MYEATDRTYYCDGMPSMFGCGASVTVRRPWRAWGKKPSGWLMTPALEPKTLDTPFDDPDGWIPDYDNPLHFCPTCAVVVEERAS